MKNKKGIKGSIDCWLADHPQLGPWIGVASTIFVVGVILAIALLSPSLHTSLWFLVLGGSTILFVGGGVGLYAQQKSRPRTTVMSIQLLQDPEQWVRFRDQQLAQARTRIQEEVRRLQALGIIDAAGNLIPTDLPDDMLSEGEMVLSTDRVLETEIATFERELPRMLAEHEGEWVAIHGEQILGFSPDRHEISDRFYREEYLPVLIEQVSSQRLILRIPRLR